MHPILELARKYPQLNFPLEHGIKDSDEYKSVTLRGEATLRKPEFSFSDKDKLEVIDTKAGPATVLTLDSREDFERIIQILVYKCEPHDVPASMGASTIIGLNNWDKVRAGLSDYKDMLIVLSSGIYSNVSADYIRKASNGRLDFTDEAWIEHSITIRKFHELRHFVDRKLRPDDVDILRDEINADRDGITQALGYYDKELARIFLGLEGSTYRPGGRLENYIKSGEDFSEFAARALDLIEI